MVLAAIGGSLAGCSHSLGPNGPATIRLTSSAFTDGGNLPAPYTCGGAGESPPLAWSNLPENTKSLALTCLDPDAPSGTFTHWLVYDISSTMTGIAEGSPPAGARQGANDFGGVGYGAPCPPSGNPHHYIFTVYALDNMPDLKNGASRKDLFSAMQGHILSKGEITGMYGRS
jgi:Raf kinase inhibitor-like YbhB/YbcL family protein